MSEPRVTNAKETVMTAWDRLEERSVQQGERALLFRLLR
jgi:hypothetical protein